MLQIGALIIGIIGLVTGRVSVTKSKELRGGGLYVVCALFILPLPLSLLAGVAIGAMYAGSSASPAQMQSLATTVGLVVGLLPLAVAFVLAFVCAQPKVDQPAT